MSYRCVCGHVISDHTYPSENTGDLKWQPESERTSQDLSIALKAFFAAVDDGTKENWLRNFFDVGNVHLRWGKIMRDGSGIQSSGELLLDFYQTADIATVVSDIVSKFDRREGHSVYRCPECERIYIQDQYDSDGYDCYEKKQGYSRS